MKPDSKHQMPQANQVLAAVLMQRGDNAGAAENLRIYVQYAPNVVDAPRVKAQLAELEQSAPQVSR